MEETEYRVKVNVCGRLFDQYRIKAESPGQALEKVKNSLWNFTVSIEVEVQGELKIVTQEVR